MRDDETGFSREVRRRYQETAPADDAARDRLIERLRASRRPRREPPWRRWAVVRDPALSGALIAAGLLAVAGAALVSNALGPRRPAAPPIPQVVAEQAVVRFELEAPGAGRVALVGDFNDWNPAATPMRRDASRDTWSVSLPVPRGRHVYAFVVDQGRWLPDPRAPLAPGDGFGTESSVIVVTGSES